MKTFVNFIRSALFLLIQAVSAIIVYLTGLLFFACPYRVRYRVITLWSHIVMKAAQWICGIHVEVKGLENIPAQNAIVLCKHQSAWETLFLQTLLPPQCWVLKKQLLWIPFFGWGLKMLEPIAIDRAQMRSIKQVLKQGKERLEAGRWVIIFPEGSRMPVGQSGNYSRSGAMLSKESGFPIVLMAHNAGLCWPRNAFIKKPGTIQLVIGPVIYPENLSVDEITSQAKTWIEETSASLVHPHPPRFTRRPLPEGEVKS